VALPLIGIYLQDALETLSFTSRTFC